MVDPAVPPDTPWRAWVQERCDRLAGRMRQAVVLSLNHVLSQHDWARDRLVVHRGRCVEVLLIASGRPWVQLQVLISALGYVEVTDIQGGADASIRVSVDARSLRGLAQDGLRGVGAMVRVDGDPLLAALMAEIARSARWDFEEDLSRIVGDAVAHRVARASGHAFRTVGAWASALARSRREDRAP